MGLTNSQYDQLMREYSRQQTASQHELAQRRAAIYRKLPELAALEADYASCAVASVEARFSGDEKAAGQLRRNMRQLAARKEALLAEGGYAPSDLEPRYQCADCRDTGYIGREKCHCFRQKAVDLFYTQSGLRSILQRENFSAFSFDYYSDADVDPQTQMTPRQNMHRIVKRCREFLAHFDEGAGNLLFYGGTGLGKTFLSHCIARELIETAHSVIYHSSQELFSALAKETFSRSSPGEDASFAEYLLDCDLLIIDDLGTELTNAFVSSQLFFLLNERIGRGKSMIISSNLSLAGLVETYSERIFSRISSSFALLGFFGDDIRIQKILT